MKLTSTVSILILCLVISSCRKDNESIIISQEEIEGPRIYHDAIVTGRVLDDEGNSISQSKVSILGNEKTTNDSGEFALINVRVNEAGSILKSQPTGYLPVYIPILIENNGLIDVVAIHDKPNLIEIPNIIKNTIDINNALSINVGNEIFEYEDGSSFEGRAKISIMLIEDEDELKKLPLGIGAQNASFNLGLIDVTKALNISVFDTEGVPLKVKKDKTMNIYINEELIGDLDVFYLNESKELWTTLTANKIDSKIEVNLSKTGVVSFGKFNEKATIKAKLEYASGQLAKNQPYNISSDKTRVNGVTSAEGNLAFVGLKGVTYNIAIQDICGNVLLSSSFETNKFEENIGTLIINGEPTTIRFDLMECNLDAYEPSDQALVEIYHNGNRSVHKASENNFEFNLLYCSAANQMNIYDGSNRLKHLSLGDFATYMSLIDMDKIYLCDDEIAAAIRIDDKIKFFNREEFYVLRENAGSLNPLTFTDLADFTLSINNVDALGKYKVVDVNSTLPDVVACNDECGSLQLNITMIGPNVGDRHIGHLSGELNGKKFLGFFDDTRFN